MLLVGTGLESIAFAQAPYGLDSRDPIGPYLNNTMPSYVGHLRSRRSFCDRRL